MSERRLHPLIDPGAVFLLAIGLRLAYVRDIESAGLGSFLRLDPLYYHEWAVRIARGEWIGAQPFEMSPLYPYLLGAVYRIFGEGLLAPKIAQAFLGALTCAVVAVLARRLSGRAAGLAAGALLATYGPALFYDGQINKTTLAMFLSALFALALLVSDGRRKGWIAFGGFVLGLAALVHENANLAAPLVVAWLLFPAGRAPWKERGARAAIFAAGWAIAVAPATAHNVAASREMVLITTGGGENFYTGNHEGASGRYSPPPFVRPDPFFEHEDFRAEAARRLSRPVTRSESSRFWWDEGWRYLLTHPGPALALLGDKFSVFWNAFERPDNFFYENFRRFSRTLSLPLTGFGIVAPLALLGMTLSARRWREFFPAFAVVAAFLLSALIFFTQSRYRMPAVPLLAVFAGQAIVSLADFARRREGWAVAICGAAIAAAFLFVNRDPGNNAAFWAQNDAILGEMYDNAGWLDEAEASFRMGVASLEGLATPENPTLMRILGAARYGLGATERRRGDHAAAETALRAALTCPDPDVRGDSAVELADLLEETGDGDGLAEALRAAVEARPGDARSRLRRAEVLFKLGRNDESLREASAVIEGRPEASPFDRADAHFGRALIERARGDEAAALADLRLTLALNPSHPRSEWIREVLAAGAGGAR